LIIHSILFEVWVQRDDGTFSCIIKKGWKSKARRLTPVPAEEFREANPLEKMMQTQVELYNEATNEFRVYWLVDMDHETQSLASKRSQLAVHG